MLINDFLTSALLIIGLRNFVKILRLRMFQQDGLGDTIGLLTGLAAEKPLGARGPGLPSAGRAREGSPRRPGRTSGASVAVWGQSGGHRRQTATIRPRVSSYKKNEQRPAFIGRS